MATTHSYHIPVMGIGFTIDTPLKVSQYGVNSVISLVDDILLEKLRKMYSENLELPYQEISNKVEDFRAKRITSYLDLIHDLAEKKFEEFKNSTTEKSDEVKAYFNMLPDSSEIKKEFKRLSEKYLNISDFENWIKENLSMGSIDVNIMTKLDKVNFIKDEQLDAEFNDAHAAVRGYAKSKLSSSLILSAGMSPRLYGYMEHFEDFFPDEAGFIKKKIVLKVSDYRSALIQGKFLAKKGLWVSEYRVESGLNCGGHAFASDGYLMGPILSEFSKNRTELITSIREVLDPALTNKNKAIPENLELLITAQGGVGTNEEHQFLIDQYQMDSIGWGTPFLLVPEATTVDEPTIQQLIKAKEKDLYLSEISPLGIPFNSLKGNSKDLEKQANIDKGRPGSACPKKFLISNKEFTDRTICTASRQYQVLKLKELDEKNLPKETHQIAFDKIVDKSCICVGLGTSALLNNDIDTKVEGKGVSICPGPNMAYFDTKLSFQEMTDHIYGRSNVISRTDRPNIFIKELNIYLEYFDKRIEESKGVMNKKQEKYLLAFSTNLANGISYYNDLFHDVKDTFEDIKATIIADLNKSEKVLQHLCTKVEELSLELKG